MDYQKHTFPNGLRLVIAPMPAVESVTVIVGVGAGSRYEIKRTNGLSHFLEHMAFKGTKKRPSTLAIASEIDGVGGEFNAFTDKEFTGYWIRVAPQHVQLAFDILADVIRNSLLRPKEIEREKGVILEEINLKKDTPSDNIWEVFIRLLYGDNPMGWSLLGEKETVTELKRDDFLGYSKNLYYPQNMVLSVAGKITKTKAKGLAQDFFGSLAGAGKKKKEPITIRQQRPRLALEFKKTEQANFCLGLPAYDLFNPKRYALGILATILGGGMSSRLFIEVRERRGLAYYVDCASELYTDSGFLVVYAGVKIDKTEEALKVVINQLFNLVEKKVSAAELKKAKEFNKGRFLLRLESSRYVASQAASQLILENKIRTVKETLQLIDQVTATEVQGVAKELLCSEKLNLAIIGPFKEGHKFSQILRRPTTANHTGCGIA